MTCLPIYRYALAALAVVAVLAPPAGAQAQKAAPVGVDKVIREPLAQTVPVIGRFVARQAGEVAARVTGVVTEMRVQIGDRVQRGDVLAVPAWRPFEHRIETDATLFCMTDAPVLRAFNWLRSEDL